MKPGQIETEIDQAFGRLDGVRRMVVDSQHPDKMVMLAQHEAKIKRIVELGVSLLKMIEGHRQGG